MTFKRITCDPKRMNGLPCIRNLRLTVRRVVEAVATYPNRADLRREYPELEDEDIREALAYADLEDLRELNTAIVRNGKKKLVPWDSAKRMLDLED